jgi:uncharacterized protein (UPF0335 family)
MLTGLVFGNILRIHRLCSTPSEIHDNTKTFYQRLITQGYDHHTLKPIFQKDTHNALAYLTRSPANHDNR